MCMSLEINFHLYPVISNLIEATTIKLFLLILQFPSSGRPEKSFVFPCSDVQRWKQCFSLTQVPLEWYSLRHQTLQSVSKLFLPFEINLPYILIMFFSSPTPPHLPAHSTSWSHSFMMSPYLSPFFFSLSLKKETITNKKQPMRFKKKYPYKMKQKVPHPRTHTRTWCLSCAGKLLFCIGPSYPEMWLIYSVTLHWCIFFDSRYKL